MRLHPRLSLIASLQYGISGPLDCHVYAIRGPEGIVLIDSGGGTHTQSLLGNLRDDLGAPEAAAVLITHTHPDHCFGAAELRRRTGCLIAAPAETADILRTADVDRSQLRAAQKQGVYPPDFLFRPCPVDLPYHDGQRLEAGGLVFHTILVRGHSMDSHCFLLDHDNRRWLFTGDALFYGGVLGLINHEGSDMEGYRLDLPKLGDLAVDGLFPGHGLFTFTGGQRHVETAIAESQKNFIPRQVGQWDLIF